MGLARLLAYGFVAIGLRKVRAKRRRTQAARGRPRKAPPQVPPQRRQVRQTEAPPPQARGRDATRPREIPLAGWKDVLFRVKEQIGDDNISLVAAGVAFFGLMALAPALAALVSVYGIFASPADIQGDFQNLIGAIPEQARQVLMDQVARISTKPDASLTFAAFGALLLTLLSAMKGSKALITAANIAYDEHERRGFLRLNAVAALLTVGGVLFAILALTMIAAYPVVIAAIPMPEFLRPVVGLTRWPVMAGLMILGLAAFYRFAPSRRSPRWRWVSWGSGLATLLWVLGSLLFSIYVGKFGNYNETYGSLGAVVVLLMWFYLSSFVVLLGAEINAEMEHQTMRDSTTGPESPLGQRGAYVADTVGRSRQ